MIIPLITSFLSVTQSDVKGVGSNLSGTVLHLENASLGDSIQCGGSSSPGGDEHPDARRHLGRSYSSSSGCCREIPSSRAWANRRRSAQR